MMVVDTPTAIRSRIEGDLIQIYPTNSQAAHDLIIQLSGVSEVQTYGEALHILVDAGINRLPEIEKVLQENGIDYANPRIAPARMEEAFIYLIGQMDQDRNETD